MNQMPEPHGATEVPVVAARSRSRLALAAAAVAAVAALLVGALVLLPMLGAEEEVVPLVQAGRPSSAAPSITTSPSPSPTAGPVQQFAGTVGRDPFKPLVAETTASAATGSGATAAPSTGSTSAAAPGTGDAATGAADKGVMASPSATGGTTGSSTGSGGSAGTGTTTAPPTVRRTLQLIDANTSVRGQENVTVRLDTAIHVAKKGEVIDNAFRVMGIGGTCATFRYGDESFKLCEGKTRTQN